MIRFFFFLLVPGFLLAQSFTSHSFILKGKISNKDSGYIYLFYPGMQSAVQDSCLLNQGQFIFKGEIKEPCGALLTNYNFLTNTSRFEKWKLISEFYIEPSDITLTASADHFNDLQLQGSKVDLDRVRLLKMKEPAERKIQPLLNEYDKLLPAYHKEYKKDSHSAEFKYFQHTIDSLSQLMEPYYDLERQTDSAFVVDNPSSWVAADMLWRSSRGGSSKYFPDLKVLYQNMPPDIQGSTYGKGILATIESENHIYVGIDAINFVAITQEKDTIQLNDFKGKKFVLLDFWASWCGPCREITPLLKEIYAKYNSQLEIISIANHDEKSDWSTAIKKDDMNWMQILDNDSLRAFTPFKSTITDSYYVNAIPSLILIDKNGKIIKLFGNSGEKKMSISSLNEELKKVLN